MLVGVPEDIAALAACRGTLALLDYCIFRCNQVPTNNSTTYPRKVNKYRVAQEATNTRPSSTTQRKTRLQLGWLHYPDQLWGLNFATQTNHDQGQEGLIVEAAGC